MIMTNYEVAKQLVQNFGLQGTELNQLLRHQMQSFVGKIDGSSLLGDFLSVYEGLKGSDIRYVNPHLIQLLVLKVFQRKPIFDIHRIRRVDGEDHRSFLPMSSHR